MTTLWYCVGMFEGHEEAVEAYRSARDAYYLAVDREDAAFRRYLRKRHEGTPTNGAALSRLCNVTSDRSAVLFSAQSRLYAAGIDPWDVDDADGVERTPV